MDTKSTTFQAWIPTRPYSLIDAINRSAAATGSVRYAMAASHADYNGHGVAVSFNDYRQYWVAEYYWGQRVVLGRGTLEDCLRAAKREQDRGALGACVIATLRTQEEYDLALSMGFLPYSKEIEIAHRATFADDRYGKVHEALRSNTTHLLIQAKSAAEYDALERAQWEERLAANRAARAAK